MKQAFIVSAILSLAVSFWPAQVFAMDTPMFNVIQIANVTTSTRFYSCGSGSAVTSASSYAPVAQPVAVAGTVHDAQVRLSAGPGAGITWTYTLVKNVTATAVVITVSGTNTTGSDNTHTVTFAPGDTCAWQASFSATPAASSFSISSIFTSTNPGESLIMGGISVPSSSVNNFYSLPGNAANVAVEASSSNIVPTNGVLDQLYVYGSSVIGAGKQWTISLVKNGVSSALTCVSGGATTALCNDTTHSVSIAPTDTVSIEASPSGTPTGSMESWSMRFKPTIDGESLLLDNGGSLIVGATRFISVNGGGGSITTESAIQAPVAEALTIRNFYGNIAVGTGVGQTWTYTVRKNAVSQTTVCTIPASSNSCSDTTHSSTFALNDLVNWQYTNSGSPAANVVGKYGAVVFVQPTVVVTGHTLSYFQNVTAYFTNGLFYFL